MAAALAEDAGDGGFEGGAVVVEAAVGTGVGAVGRARWLAGGWRLHPVQAAGLEQCVHALEAVGLVGHHLRGDEAGHAGDGGALRQAAVRSEEHTSELQSLMRISYAVFCLKKKNKHKTQR